MKKNIILHVGLQKTATTFIQLNIFPSLKNSYSTFYEDKNFYNTPFGELLIEINEIDKANQFHLSKIIEYRIKIENFINEKEVQNIIISCEDLVGIIQLIYNNKEYFNNEKFSNILKAVMPESKIFLVIRNQADWVESLYNQHIIKQNRFLKFNEFIGYKNTKFIQGKYLDINKLDWHKLVKTYNHLFGDKNVLVLPYEMFKANPKLFLEKFYNFFEIEPYYPETYPYVNTKKNILSIQTKPFLETYYKLIKNLPRNKFRIIIEKNSKYLQKFLGFYVKSIDYSKEKFDSNTKKQFIELLKKSNQQLSELINVDLSCYGYY
ncbi:MAG: hypothetical protein A2X64_07575 [Ignavibacteria bacterium GWF2_33_9]|nr:MAG: hypothetical protein A2X64_07575 [Ignavibacteria bacterium GWF2_33_9]